MSEINQHNKELVWALWQRLNHVADEGLADALASAMTGDIAWHGPHPINDITGIDDLVTEFLAASAPRLPRFETHLRCFHWRRKPGRILGHRHRIFHRHIRQ